MHPVVDDVARIMKLLFQINMLQSINRTCRAEHLFMLSSVVSKQTENVMATVLGESFNIVKQ